MPGPPPPPPSMMPPPPKFTPMAPKAGGDNRNALLGQIQKGKALKKVQTVDKSGPAVAGRVAGEAPSSSPSRGAPSRSSPPDTATSSPVRKPPGGFANLTDELQYKMTLKKNKNSPVKESSHIPEPKETTPPALSTTSSRSFIDEIKSKQNVITAHQIPSQAPSISDAIANKSSLFSKSQPVGAPVPTVLSAPKVINHGKPNLAPKPPPQLKLVTSGNNSNSSLNGESNRKSVARHQSMKSPRSPPVALTPSGPFNSDNHFGTIRMNANNHQKIQDALNSQAHVQKPSAQRPTNKPPPPPVPNRQPGTNLTNNHAKSTNALNLSASEPRRLPNSGSSNNISNMDRSNNMDAVDAPPLPPHRLSSQSQQRAPPTPVPVVNNPPPPEVPRRHSSMRNSIENGANGKYQSPNPNQPITRLVVDLEARYSLLFHNVSEFPAPRPFMNLEKSYPSRALRQSNGI